MHPPREKLPWPKSSELQALAWLDATTFAPILCTTPRHSSLRERMSDDSVRPAKRARLADDTAIGVPSDTHIATAEAPKATWEASRPAATAAINDDLAREVRAGITEYVCPDNLGFAGVLKQRYTDFLVNEIALDGQVVHLRTIGVGKSGRKENAQKEDNVVLVDASGESKEVKEESADRNGTVDAPNVSTQVEDASAHTGLAEGEAGKQEQEVKEEVDIPVPCPPASASPELANDGSYPKTIVALFTTYSARTPPNKFSHLFARYADANTRKRKTSKP